MAELTRECPRCKQVKPDKDFKIYARGKRWNCRVCELEWHAIEFAGKPQDPRLRIWARSRENARRVGIEHTITPEDISMPNVCKYTGLILVYDEQMAKEIRIRRRKWANEIASLDRIDSNKGYVPGNVQVISYLANRMKQDASLEDLIRFAEGVLKVHKPEIFKRRAD